MEHVKQEVAKNPEKAKDWEKVQKTAASVSAKLNSAKESVSPGYTKAKDMFAKIKASAGPATAKADVKLSRFAVLRSRLNDLKTHPAALKTSEFFSTTSELLGARLASSMDKFNQVVLRRLQEDERQPELHARWSAQRAARQHAAQAAQAAQPTPGEEAETSSPQKSHPHGDALTVTEQPKAGGFGLGGMDAMPLLTETVSRLLGESEIAQCVREMKTLDSNFRLSALQDEMERIVAPKFLEWFLAGDREKLRVHLGEAAFASVNSSLQARLKARAKPDQRILYGPRDVELWRYLPRRPGVSHPALCSNSSLSRSTASARLTNPAKLWKALPTTSANFTTSWPSRAILWPTSRTLHHWIIPG
jgi:hypothetical protein